MGNIKIQIVEDERILAKDIERQLSNMGYKIVSIASTGQRAMDEASKYHPDLILMDIKIRGPMDGIETAKRVHDTLGIPVVYITAFSDEKTLKRAKITEPFGYLVKPFESRELHAVIEMAMYKHQMEIRLKESERKYRTLTENTNDIVFTLSPKNIITHIGPQIQRYGYKQDELIMKNFVLFMIPEDQDGVKNILNEITSHGKPSLCEFRIRNYVKKTVWLESQMTVQNDSHGHVIGLTGVLRDITIRKEKEEERRRLFNELEIAHAELERFIHVISHDLKNPLITINGFLGLLKKDILALNQKKIKEDVETVSQAVKQIHRLINELTVYCSKSRQYNKQRSISLEKLLNEVLNILNNEIADLKAEVKVVSEMPAIYGNRRQLLDIFINLIKNGIQYVPSRSNPLVEIGCEKKDNQMLFFIRDNGMGIEPKYQNQIFNLFEQLGKKQQGAGTGLAITKRLIEMHGGRIWVESGGKGKGSTFYFTLGEMKDGKING